MLFIFAPLFCVFSEIANNSDSSIGNFTPQFVHSQYHQISDEKIKRLWKNYYTKRTIFANSFQD